MKTLSTNIKFYKSINSVIVTDDIEYAKKNVIYPHRDSVQESELSLIPKVLGLTKLYIFIKKELNIFDLNKFIKELGLIIYHDVKLVICAKKVLLNNIHIEYLVLYNRYVDNEIYIDNSIIKIIDITSDENAVKLVIKDSNIPEYKEGKLRKKFIDIEVYNSTFHEHLYINSYSYADLVNLTAYNSYLGIHNISSNTFIFNIKGENNNYYFSNIKLKYKDIIVFEYGIKIGNTIIRRTYDFEKVKHYLDKITDIKEIRKLLHNVKIVNYVKSFNSHDNIDIPVIINKIVEYLEHRFNITYDN